VLTLCLEAHNRTGKYSYYTQFHDLEIMYHVAPLLPATPTEEQQLERKRHVGNDIVVLLFRDADCKSTHCPLRSPGTDSPAAEFDPTVVASHFNHIFVVVQPEERTDGSSMTRYKYAPSSCRQPLTELQGSYCFQKRCACLRASNARLWSLP
jgi:hypothetical protein